MNAADATREIYWNVTNAWVMYALLVPTLAVGGWGVWRRVRRWRRGVAAPGRFDRPLLRLRRVVAEAVAQRRTARRRDAAVFHRAISYGFVVLTVATLVVALDADFGTAIMHGSFYLWFQSLAVDLFGAAVLAGIAMAAWRRWRDPRPAPHAVEAALLLASIAFIAASGFLIEAWRIEVTRDPWRVWSPIGSVLGRASAMVLGVEAMRGAHRVLWWLHLAASLAFVAWVPYTRLRHALTSPLNVYTSNLEPIGGSLASLDLEGDRSCWKR